ncbi:hypothetical protein [Streptomyces canus]|uniref:hypothetical protein n=1 Tax=Streptomyces canus TaxID=58343 RepID=UPI0030E11B7D
MVVPLAWPAASTASTSREVGASFSGIQRSETAAPGSAASMAFLAPPRNLQRYDTTSSDAESITNVP